MKISVTHLFTSFATGFAFTGNVMLAIKNNMRNLVEIIVFLVIFLSEEETLKN